MAARNTEAPNDSTDRYHLESVSALSYFLTNLEKFPKLANIPKLAK